MLWVMAFGLPTLVREVKSAPVDTIAIAGTQMRRLRSFFMHRSREAVSGASPSAPLAVILESPSIPHVMGDAAEQCVSRDAFFSWQRSISYDH